MNKFFSEEERNSLYNSIIDIARSDERVLGGALVGSFANEQQDAWSDVDISFGVKESIKPSKVLDDWVQRLQSKFEIVHYFDVPHSLAIYRVILFSNGIEVDLSVVPESEFGPKSSSFKLLFGTAKETKEFSSSTTDKLFGWSWHHVMHANAALNRDRLWSAQFWINELRNHIISMMCIRLNLPSSHCRGADQLPMDQLKKLETTLIVQLQNQEMRKVLANAADILIAEIKNSDESLANNLSTVFSKVLERNKQ